MANYCEILFKLKGTKENRSKFIDALEQKGADWIGRGAEAEPIEETDTYSIYSGWTKWAISASLIDCAVEMREQPEVWSADVLEHNIYTIKEYAEKCNLYVEMFGTETNCGFQEHLIICNGEMDYTTRYYYGESIDCLDESEIAEIEKALGREITDEEYDNNYVEEGGYENYGEFII